MFNPYRPMTASHFGTIVYRSFKPKLVKYRQPNWPARQLDILLYRFSLKKCFPLEPVFIIFEATSEQKEKKILIRGPPSQVSLMIFMGLFGKLAIGDKPQRSYRVTYPATWQANLVGDILLFFVYSYDRRLFRNTTLLLD